VLVIVLLIVTAFVFAYWWLLSYLSPGSCPESESESESGSKSRTPTLGTTPVSSVVLDTNRRPVDRLLIKNVENFYFLFDGFPYTLSLLYFALLHFLLQYVQRLTVIAPVLHYH